MYRPISRKPNHVRTRILPSYRRITAHTSTPQHHVQGQRDGQPTGLDGVPAPDLGRLNENLAKIEEHEVAGRKRPLCVHRKGATRAFGPGHPSLPADLRAIGQGTERSEQALQRHFPHYRITRIDRDSTRRKGSMEQKLREAESGHAQILLGTQLLAKGHHFPKVGLVGVLAADDGLGLPDYRAAERSFQLLTQVAGRSGRTGAGRVIFQTWRPEDPVIRAAAEHDEEQHHQHDDRECLLEHGGPEVDRTDQPVIDHTRPALMSRPARYAVLPSRLHTPAPSP